MLFSWSTWSTCFNFTMSNFFNILRAKYFPVFFCFASLTLPNEPTFSPAYLSPESATAQIRKYLAFASRPSLLIKYNVKLAQLAKYQERRLRRGATPGYHGICLRSALHGDEWYVQETYTNGISSLSVHHHSRGKQEAAKLFKQSNADHRSHPLRGIQTQWELIIYSIFTIIRHLAALRLLLVLFAYLSSAFVRGSSHIQIYDNLTSSLLSCWRQLASLYSAICVLDVTQMRSRRATCKARELVEFDLLEVIIFFVWLSPYLQLLSQR